MLGAVTLVIESGCSSGSDAVCVSSDAGEVCADGSDGSITFSGTGLEPGSEVRMENDQVGPVVLVAEAEARSSRTGRRA